MKKREITQNDKTTLESESPKTGKKKDDELIEVKFNITSEETTVITKNDESNFKEVNLENPKELLNSMSDEKNSTSASSTDEIISSNDDNEKKGDNDDDEEKQKYSLGIDNPEKSSSMGRYFSCFSSRRAQQEQPSGSCSLQ